MTKAMVKAIGALSLTIIMSSNLFATEVDFGSKAALEDPSFTVEEMLQYAIEDERMAQAEYEAIIEAFDVTRPFSNILKAEYKHEEALLELYEAYGYEVPTFDAHPYTVLPETLEEIYAIGVEAEIANIDMYKQFLEEDLEEDVATVFTALMEASVKHQAAFERGITGGNGGTGKGNRGGQGRNRRNR